MWRRCLCVLLLLSCVLSAQESLPVIWVGMDREQLVDTLGHPESMAATEKRMLYFYKDGVRFELENGIVVSVQGYKGRIEFSDPHVEHSQEKTNLSGQPSDARAPRAAPPAGAAAPAGRSSAKAAKGSMPTLAHLSEKAVIPGEKAAAPYSQVTAPAVDAFLRLASFFQLVYDPRFIDDKGNWQPPATLTLACLLRLGLVMFALRFAGRRCERELQWNEYLIYGFYDIGLRLLGAGLEDRFFPGTVHAVAWEAIVAGFLFLIIWRAADRPSWWLALRMVLIAKVTVLTASFALLLLLLNLSVG